MTIDQMNEIAEWLSPLDKYVIRHDLQSISAYRAEAIIYMPSQIIYFYFDSYRYITIETPSGIQEEINNTSIWEQICLRNL